MKTIPNGEKERVIMKKRKLSALAAVLVMSLCFASCGESSDDNKTSTSEISTAVVSESEVSVQEQSAYTSKKLDFDDPDTVKALIEKIKAEAVDGVVTLKFWCTSDDMTFEKTQIEKFKETFSDPSFEYKISVVAVGEDESGRKVLEADNIDRVPDVFNTADYDIESLAKAESIAPVDEMFADTVNSSNTDASIAVSSYNNTLYAFPKTSDNGYFLYYDKRVLSEDDVKDLDTMIERSAAAEKMVYMNLTNSWYSTSFFLTAGCDIRNDNGKQAANFDSEESFNAVKAMCHIAENEQKGFAGSPGTLGASTYIAQCFTEGTVSAAVCGTWMGPSIKRALGEENIGAAKLPTVLMNGQQMQLHSFGGYKLMAVKAQSKAPFTSQLLAYYLTSEKTQFERYTTRGLIPTNTTVLAMDPLMNDPAVKAIEDQRPYSHAQGEVASAEYWVYGIGKLGKEIVERKGALTDEEIREKLKSLAVSGSIDG